MIKSFLVVALLSLSIQIVYSASYVRFANAFLGTVNLDFYLNNSVIVSNTTYYQISDYQELISGTFSLNVSATDKSVSFQKSIQLNDSNYTIVAVGLPSQLSALIFEDDNSAPIYGFSKLRIINLSPDSKPLDSLITTPTSFVYESKNLSFTANSSYVEIRPARYNFQVYNNSANYTIPISFEESVVYTIFYVGSFYSDDSKNGFRFFISVDATYPTSLPSFIRLTHVSPDASKVSVAIQNSAGVLILSQTLDFGVTIPNVGYQAVNSGKLTFTATPSGSNVNVTVSLELVSDKFYTVVVGGLSQKLTINSFEDMLPEKKSNSTIRFIHASPDLSQLNLILNNTLVFSQVNYLMPTAYNSVLPGVAKFNSLLSGTNSIISSADLTLRDGEIHTIYADGDNNNHRLTTSLDYSPFVQQANIRVAHAAPGSPKVNITLNGIAYPIFSNLEYGMGPSNFSSIPINKDYVNVTVSFAEGGPVLSKTIAVEPSLQLTIIVVGLANASTNDPLQLDVMSLNNYNFFPSPSKSTVRIVNLSPSRGLYTKIGSFNIPEVSYLSSSLETEIPAGEATFVLSSSSGDRILLSQTLNFVGGEPYSVFIQGLPTYSMSVLQLKDPHATPAPTTPPETHSGLSGGAIFGIIVSCLFGGFLIGASVFYFFGKKTNYEVIN